MSFICVFLSAIKLVVLGGSSAPVRLILQIRRHQNKTPDELLALTFSRNKANYIINVAQQLASSALDLESLSTLPDAELMERLVSIKGIGRWTAQYMLLRGYGRLNSFPIDDSGARARLIEFLGMEKTTALDRLERYINRWKPYSGLLYFHLLLYNLDKRGHMS